MKIGIKILEASLEEMIIYEAVCKPLIEEILSDFLGMMNSKLVEKEED